MYYFLLTSTLNLFVSENTVKVENCSEITCASFCNFDRQFLNLSWIYYRVNYLCGLDQYNLSTWMIAYHLCFNIISGCCCCWQLLLSVCLLWQQLPGKPWDVNRLLRMPTSSFSSAAMFWLQPRVAECNEKWWILSSLMVHWWNDYSTWTF